MKDSLPYLSDDLCNIVLEYHCPFDLNEYKKQLVEKISYHRPRAPANIYLREHPNSKLGWTQVYLPIFAQRTLILSCISFKKEFVGVMTYHPRNKNGSYKIISQPARRV